LVVVVLLFWGPLLGTKKPPWRGGLFGGWGVFIPLGWWVIVPGCVYPLVVA